MVQTYLQPAEAPPPLRARMPVLRVKDSQRSQTVERWASAMASTVTVKTPEPVRHLTYEFAGPETPLCGVNHAPVYDVRRFSVTCSVCGVSLEHRIKR
jgi:hypothetical protein